MKKERLDEIKKELEKVVEFREGFGVLKDSFFGKQQGTSITLTYRGDYSYIWIGKHKDVAMCLLDCTVKIEDSKIRFRSQDCVVVVGE